MNNVTLQCKLQCERQCSGMELSRVHSVFQRHIREMQEFVNQMLAHNRPTLNSIRKSNVQTLGGVCTDDMQTPPSVCTTSISGSESVSPQGIPRPRLKLIHRHNEEWLKVIQKYLPEEEVKNFPEGLLMENDPTRNRAVRSVLKENQDSKKKNKEFIILRTEHTRCCKNRNHYKSEVSGNTIRCKMRPQSPHFKEMNFPVYHCFKHNVDDPFPTENIYGDKTFVLSNIEKRLEGYRVYEYMTRVWLSKKFEVNKVFLVTKKELPELKPVTHGLDGLAVYYASPQKTHHITLDLMIDMQDSKDAIFECEFSESHNVRCIWEHLYGNRGTSECTKPRNAWERPPLPNYLKTPQPAVTKTPRDESKFSPPLSNKRPLVGEDDVCKRRRMFAPQQKSAQKSVFEKFRDKFVNRRGMNQGIQGTEYKLREPQRNFLNKVIENEQFRYALNCAPTGTGKTDTMAMAHFVVKEVKKGLIVCDSTYVEDLHAQLKTFFDKLPLTQRVRVELIKKDGFQNIPDADVYVVGTQNLADKAKILTKTRNLVNIKFDLVQFDEAHKGNSTPNENNRMSVLERELITLNRKCHFIYHTATPTGKIKDKCEKEHNICCMYSRHQALKSGKGIIKGVERVPYKNNDDLFKLIVAELRKKRAALGIPIRAIILTNSVNSTQECARKFNEYVNKTVCDDPNYHYYAKPLTGKNSKKEREIKDRFESLRFEDRPHQKLRIDVLFVCGKCVESYNNPMISVVGFAYSTSTKAGEVRIPQFIGRGLRKTPRDYIQTDIITTETAKEVAEKKCSIIYPREMTKAINEYEYEGTLAGCSQRMR